MRRMSLLILCLIASLMSRVAVEGQTNPTSAVTRPSQISEPRGSEPTATAVNGQLTYYLWRSRIEAPDPNEDAQTRNSIDELIRKIRSVKFDENNPEPAFTPPSAETPSTDESVSTEPPAEAAVTASEISETPQAKPTVPTAGLSQATQNRLEGLLENPAQMREPLEMAELLFLSGRPVEAGAFYERALALMSSDDLEGHHDRAWVLFQLGNCLRETDLTKAKEHYTQLIADYPNSPWTDLAKAHERLITWYQSVHPEQLTAQKELP